MRKIIFFFILLVPIFSYSKDKIPTKEYSGKILLEFDTHDRSVLSYAYRIDQDLAIEAMYLENKQFDDSIYMPRIIVRAYSSELLKAYIYGGAGISSKKDDSSAAANFGGQIDFQAKYFLVEVRKEHTAGISFEEDVIQSTVGYRVLDDEGTKYWLTLDGISRSEEDSYRWGPMIRIESEKFNISVGMSNYGDFKLSMAIHVP